MRVVGATVLLARFAAGHGVADAGVASGWRKPPTPTGVTAGDHDYEVEGQTYQGYLALPPADRTPVGSVLVAHQWMGLIDYEKARTEEMAAMGYVAFAVDVYGKGKRCMDADCASKQMGLAKSNATKLEGLLSAGTQQLLQLGGDRERLVAMGYCFGGGNVLELARHPGVGASEGVIFKAVSGIHASLTPLAEPAADGEIVTHVQAHHAELDYSGDAGLAGLEAELRVGVNGTEAIWEAIKYAKCKHGWTEPGTAIYNARAAVQAHKSTFEFFQMALGNEDPEADAFPLSPFCQQKIQDAPELVLLTDAVKSTSSTHMAAFVGATGFAALVGVAWRRRTSAVHVDPTMEMGERC